MSDYTELKRLAEAATPTPWERGDGNEVMVSEEGDEAYWSWEQAGPAQIHGSGEQPVRDADFIAAANPAAVMALIAENERLQGCEEVLRQLASYCGCGGYNAPEVDPEVFAKKIMDGINILNDPLVQLAERRAAERDQLRAEVAGLRTGYEAYERVNAELKAENEALVSAMNDILRVTPMGVEAFGIAALVLGELSATAMGKGEQS